MICIQIKILSVEVLNEAGFYSKSNNRMQVYYKPNRHTQTKQNDQLDISCF